MLYGELSLLLLNTIHLEKRFVHIEVGWRSRETLCSDFSMVGTYELRAC